MRKINLIILIICFFSYSGCVSSGNSVLKNETEQSISQKIIEGKTTLSEIQSLFGPPISKSFTDSGNEVWEYTFVASSAKATTYIPVVSVFSGGGNSKVKELKIFFNKNNIVKKYLMTDSDVEVKTGILQ